MLQPGYSQGAEHSYHKGLHVIYGHILYLL